ncbi:MAG: F0F1 ATP synthase subunit delta [Candidatus Saccharimonadales bacterium]
MAVRLSRRKLASYCADQLMSGNKVTVIQELAAYLVEKRRTNELELIVRDIEDALLLRGIAIADVVTARELTAETLKQVKSFVTTQYANASVQLRTRIEPEVLGGIKVSLPGEELDRTLQRKIATLKASKV